ncbi:MAG: hypothetical protein IKL09_09600, partial [Clostridia bacterium]|nr:hypothetical protein [Clostridia bacterium]
DAGMGKGALTLCRELVSPINAELHAISKQLMAECENSKENIETILKICEALHITPDVILTEDNPNLSAKQADLLNQLDKCTIKQKETALELLSVYLKSLI